MHTLNSSNAWDKPQPSSTIMLKKALASLDPPAKTFKVRFVVTTLLCFGDPCHNYVVLELDNQGLFGHQHALSLISK